MATVNDLAGKVIAVTGGASGIGLATTQLLLSRGASVSVVDISETALRSTAAALSVQHGDLAAGRVLFARVDVSNRQQVESWIESTIQRFGKLDGAANCAGVIGKHHGVKPVFELDDDQWDLIMGVNLKGTMNCMRAQLNHMQEGSSLVCVTSIESEIGKWGHGAYSASKHGVLGLIRCASLEMGPKGIRINGVAPGLTDTPLVRHANKSTGGASFLDFKESAMQRAAKPEEVANVIAFLLSDSASFVNGQNYRVDGSFQTEQLR